MAEEATETTTEETQAEATGSETEETQAPDVGEALQQMSQRFDALEERFPQPEETPDALSQLTAPLAEEQYGEQEQYGQGQQYGQEQQAEQTQDDSAELRQLLGEAAQEAVLPWILQQETEKRETAIRAFADAHPNFKDEAVDHVAQMLEATGQMPQNGLPPDPRVVEAFYKAYEADRARSDSETSTAEADGEGATLETGAGPGAPEEEVDPVEQAYMEALRPRGSTFE